MSKEPTKETTSQNIHITFYEEEINFPDSSEGVLTKNEVVYEDSPASRGLNWGSSKKAFGDFVF